MYKLGCNIASEPYTFQNLRNFQLTIDWNKKVLSITGGTGSFGNRMLDFALKTNVKEIRIVSRDEYKHEMMRFKFSDPRISYHIADVRDKPSIKQAIDGSHFLFHAAALKQVPACENFPIEAVKTNILGSQNVLESAIETEVQNVVVLSTDKAVSPVNAMGISKSMMEKLAISKGKNSKSTRINITRYGNVLFSRGSVIPYFLELARRGEKLPLTVPHMTRFLLPLKDATDLVVKALGSEKSGSIFVKKSQSASVLTISKAINKIAGMDESNIFISGIRPGEKIHECLLSYEEMSKATEEGDYFVVDADNSISPDTEPYGSDTAKLMNQDDLISLIQNQDEFAHA